MEDDFNPWEVPSLDEFLFYFCPECENKYVTKSHLIKHAFKVHPKAKKAKLNRDITKESVIKIVTEFDTNLIEDSITI